MASLIVRSGFVTGGVAITRAAATITHTAVTLAVSAAGSISIATRSSTGAQGNMATHKLPDTTEGTRNDTDNTV